MNEDINRCIEELTPKLPQYLDSLGIEHKNGKLFRCLCPAHKDSTPSMGIVKANPKFVKCLSCGAKGNILHVASWAENRPLFGKEFIEETVNYLARKLGVKPAQNSVSQEDLQKMTNKRVFAAFLEYGRQYGTFKTIQDKRGWNEKTCKTLGVFIVQDYYKALQYVKDKLGITSDNIVTGTGISPKLFGPSKITFTLFNRYGEVEGFCCRNLDYEFWKAEAAKGVEVKPYNLAKYDYIKPFEKASYVYNMNSVKPPVDTLFIFEGQGSAITAHQFGLLHCVSCGGGDGLNAKQLEKIQNLEPKTIVIAFDFDKNGAGQDKTLKTIQKLIPENYLSRIKIVDWEAYFEDKEEPEVSSVDPDWFIFKYGIKEFLTLPKVDTFTWEYREMGKKMETIELAQFMTESILNRSSIIEQGILTKTLSNLIDLDTSYINQEIQRLKNIKQNIEDAKTQQIVNIEK